MELDKKKANNQGRRGQHLYRSLESLRIRHKHSFGVVMLEILTGRKPFDSSRSRSEQYLVRWETPLLHDIDALDKMVDSSLKGHYLPKSLSRFADVVALCVQSKPEFRPPMSEASFLSCTSVVFGCSISFISRWCPVSSYVFRWHPASSFVFSTVIKLLSLENSYLENHAAISSSVLYGQPESQARLGRKGY
ncbi:hypothetical protein MKW98_026175 [Papaver atlanticum]|uniref:Protein kinase domain-containing protein n=1 Tax=Papaver atlanticum TaxID=357466 RepID=A0AAD4TMA5_9MAGN|nr:hypothetical protein MKW98_026175 [Papaver atlanticum]